ncbi:PucR family transcriptional regulator ligand-binding domain-containing protein [Niallia taxi]|uniref:PucR family transcriptional regulator n=1 Tax=Niallia taxi TaxID=2499688 RepID=UPI00203CE84C|nr:PucR family transcriptional regulator [Niallia taxi]MCM3213931.1 PucR family transcriptional regulator ligand-binding domain-containing protein [Niallia taxi]
MNSVGITINELLRLPVLKDAKVISGEKGLNRMVRYLDIMEVPDIKGWLREGELLLTTAYAIRHDTKLLSNLVQHLAQADAAALAIKRERYLRDLPEEMLQISNDFNLPIIELPTEIPYIDITNAVMELLIDKQTYLLRRSEELYKKLTTLVLENSGIQTVADNVSGLLKSPIWLLDRKGNTIVSAPQGDSSSPFADIRCWEITVDKQIVGKLYIERDNLDDLDMVCVEQARLVFALELMRRKTAIDTERKLRGSFIEELLTGLPLTKQEVMNKGRQLGLNPDISWRIIVLENKAELEENHALFQKMETVLKRHFSLYFKKSCMHIHMQANRIVLLFSFQAKDGTAEKWKELFTPILIEFKEIRIGVGTEAALWEVQHSFIQARKAILLGSSLDLKQHLFTYEEMEVFNLLLDASDYVNMDEAVEKNIGKLCQYDKENDTDLVKTLFYYLTTDGSLVETANLLYIHRNSVKYRMDKIEKVANIKIASFREKFVYYLCIFYYLFKNPN